MANIEIHGLKNTEALSMRSHIDDVMRLYEAEGDCIITIIPSLVKSCNNESTVKPFLRIYGETEFEVSFIFDILKNGKIKLDCEGVVLCCYRSAAKMK